MLPLSFDPMPSISKLVVPLSTLVHRVGMDQPVAQNSLNVEWCQDVLPLVNVSWLLVLDLALLVTMLPSTCPRKRSLWFCVKSMFMEVLSWLNENVLVENWLNHNVELDILFLPTH